MNKNDIESLLKAEKENFIPDMSDKIEEIKTMNVRRVPVSAQSGKSNRFFPIKLAAALCSLFAIIIPVYLLLKQPAAQTVHALYIDVNPSIKLEIDDNENVLDAKLLNNDAQTLLDINRLKAKKLETALEIIIEKLHNRGYFDDEDAEIILSMGDFEEDTLLQKYRNKVSAVLVKRAVICKIVNNRITKEEQKEVEREPGNGGNVTPGQLKYIREIIEKEPASDVNALKGKRTPVLKMINAILEEDTNQRLGELLDLKESELVERYNEVRKNTGNNNPGNNTGNNQGNDNSNAPGSEKGR